MINPWSKPIVRQYLIVIVANFTYLGFGMQTGWTSPVIAKLKAENQTVLPEPISDYDASWVVSIGILVGAFGMIISGFLMDYFGRKTCLIVFSFPRIVQCFLLLFATDVWMLLLARGLNGLSDTFGICLVFTYTSEIASKEVRGALGTVAQMSNAVGAMIMLAVGPFLSYRHLNIMNTVTVLVLFVPLMFLPESPYYLYAKGHKEESVETLTFLRGSKEAAYEELADYAAYSNVSVDKIKILKDPAVLKSFLKACFLAFGAQLTGYNSISFYLQTVFASTNTNVTPEVSSLVIGFIELLGCTCTILLIDRFGRKPMLIVSLMLMAVGLIGMGTFFYLKDRNYVITGFLNFLPLLSIMISIFFYNAGLGSILMIYIAELFDGSARAIGVSAVCFLTSFMTYIVVRFFAAVTTAVGPMSTYYGFSVGCGIVCLFVIFCLPETKGKTFSEIQKEMNDKRDGKDSKT